MESSKSYFGECIAVKVLARGEKVRNLYFLATDIDSAVKVTELRGYDPVEWSEVSFREVPRTIMYHEAVKWAKDHKRQGKPALDVFCLTP